MTIRARFNMGLWILIAKNKEFPNEAYGKMRIVYPNVRIIYRMEYYFITGTSRGIGEALAQTILGRKESAVTGIARHNSFAAEDFHFVELDLSDVPAVTAFQFPECKDATKMALVNNAGALGDVDYTGELNDSVYPQVLNVNLITPAILTNKFLAAYSAKKIPLVIINISSGAGKNPVDGWGAYCASKAGLDMFSQVVAEELAISGKKHIRIFAVAPGVVDTAMQTKIRTVKSENFSRIQDFINYKTSGQLADPHLIARKLLSILDSPEKFAETVFSAREIRIENQHTNQ